MYLGIAARLGETRAALCDQAGQVVQRWDQLESIEVDPSGLEVACCYTDERQKDLQEWIAPLDSVWVTSWPDAALAGAFSGQPGVLLATEHWTMYAGCAAKNGPEPICQALAMAREANHRTLAIAHGEGGLEWLSREALRLLQEVSGPSQHRLRLRLGPHQGDLTEMGPMRQRALAVRTNLEELADYPGPDPASLAVLAKAGRRLSDLLRRLTARVRLGNPTRAAWLDGRLEGPLWQAITAEFERYLPELRWQAPEADAAVGAARLALGACKEAERRALNPAVTPAARPSGLLPLDADAWRQLSRLKITRPKT
jgi:hypothetical protein